MKSGPVYEVGGSINRVYNPCRVVCQNAALSSCNRFFSDEARVANILKIQRNCFTCLNYNTVLEIKILKVRCRFCTISEHVNKAKKNRIYLESITHIWPSLHQYLWSQRQPQGAEKNVLISISECWSYHHFFH